MNKVCLLSGLLIGIIWQAVAQEKLVKQKINDQIIIKIPASFMPMTESDMWQRVSSYRKSLGLYTDPDRLVELGVNRSYSVWEEGDYRMIYEVYKSSILELYDEVEFIKEEITEIKRHPFVVFEFISKVYDEEGNVKGPIVKYTYLQYTLHEGQTLVFNFSCPRFQMEKWKTTAHEVMNSIVLK